ncbi:MAG TPA: rod shape-determining protein MreD [Armatimonadetes bacterium]|nr:rod shape-determining protein MreD [Armatimonadota bacterium]
MTWATLVLGLHLFLAAGLQVAVLAFWPAKVRPDLLLIWPLVAGVLYGPRLGMLAGFGGGLWLFALQGFYPGSFLLSHTTTGYLAGLVGQRFFKENWVVHVLTVGGGTFISEGIFFVLSLQVGLADWWPTVWREALYNALLTPLAFVALRRLSPAEKETTV